MIETRNRLILEAFEQLPRELKEFLDGAERDPVFMQELFLGVIAGDCPICGSFKTLDGGDTPLRDTTVGICLECYCMICLECGEILGRGQTQCDHRRICDQCHGPGSENGCHTPIWECQEIEEWKIKRKSRYGLIEYHEP